MLTILLSACARAPEPQFGPSDLADDWVMMSEGTEYPDGCESDTTVRYFSDGTFAFLDFSGTWQLENNVLTEIEGDPDIKTGKPFRSTLRWNGLTGSGSAMPTGRSRNSGAVPNTNEP